MKLLSVIIPLYRERESVAPLHARLMESLKSLNTPFEIILVDNNSTDESLSFISTNFPTTKTHLHYGQSKEKVR